MNREWKLFFSKNILKKMLIYIIWMAQINILQKYPVMRFPHNISYVIEYFLPCYSLVLVYFGHAMPLNLNNNLISFALILSVMFIRMYFANSIHANAQVILKQFLYFLRYSYLWIIDKKLVNFHPVFSWL